VVAERQVHDQPGVADVDFLLAGLQTARTVYAVAAPDSAYQNPNTVLPRGVDIGIGLALTTLYAVSAGIGFSATAECQHWRAGPARGGQGAVRRRVRSSQEVDEAAQEWLREQEAERRARAQQAEAARAAGEAASASSGTQGTPGPASTSAPPAQPLPQPPPPSPAPAQPALRPPSTREPPSLVP